VRKLKAGTQEGLRTHGSIEDFQLLCEIAFAPMISRETWKLNHTEVNISSLLTVADEAFALLTMENNVCEWINLVKYGKERTTRGELTRFTSQGKNSDGTKKGWTLEGKKRFNELFDAVILTRAAPRSKELEEGVRDLWKKNEGSSGKKGNRTESEAEEALRKEEETFVPRNGFLN
jgi:hypothetical protein